MCSTGKLGRQCFGYLQFFLLFFGSTNLLLMSKAPVKPITTHQPAATQMMAAHFELVGMQPCLHFAQTADRRPSALYVIRGTLVHGEFTPPPP